MAFFWVSLQFLFSQGDLPAFFLVTCLAWLFLLVPHSFLLPYSLVCSLAPCSVFLSFLIPSHGSLNILFILSSRFLQALPCNCLLLPWALFSFLLGFGYVFLTFVSCFPLPWFLDFSLGRHGCRSYLPHVLLSLSILFVLLPFYSVVLLLSWLSDSFFLCLPAASFLVNY